MSDLLKFRRKLAMILTFYSRIKLQSRRANLAVKKDFIINNRDLLLLQNI